MAKEYQTHHRQEILVAGIVRVCPQRVCHAPETFLDGLDMFKLRQYPLRFRLFFHKEHPNNDSKKPANLRHELFFQQLSRIQDDSR
jgi:hypothetical protein